MASGLTAGARWKIVETSSVTDESLEAIVNDWTAQGWLDRDRIIMETLTAIRRAGASIILTYWAAEAARRLA